MPAIAEPEDNHPATVMRVLVMLNAIVAILMGLAGSEARQVLLFWAGLVPARLTLAVDGQLPVLGAASTLFGHMFLHGGAAHLLMNMVMLIAIGRILEPTLGSRRFLVLYLVSGLAGGLAEWAWSPLSTIPAVGASGAISGLVAAQAMLFGQSKRGPLMQALGLAVAWVVLQVLAGAAMGGPDLRIAIMAHIGGFIAGLALARPLMRGAQGA
ncbi:rhomboid family intramembrane serine protease [Sandarakinorhabdus sp.]|uniref:rhomboid family intramembrane serine protease n=1 Tax=Sandarakinorhabdus sp. TaxID=1916663 RepID=UPI00286E99C6|nr:rhomboid family intramembrane serine protease [Sandarakinorhabdus sp.]